MSLEELQSSYNSIKPDAERLCSVLSTELLALLASKGLTLGVPIESRVKSWESLVDKVERRALKIRRAEELSDLVGIRMILLFQRDVEEACQLVKRSLSVLSSENTGERLDESQFGYQSQHYIVRIPKEWLNVPTLQKLEPLCAELQVRSLAQHIWAAASHKLQYKQEKSVPSPVRRSIHRVSALLETVDLEFERVLRERESYIASLNKESPQAELNVDLLTLLMDEILPPQNKVENEPYSDLLKDLLHFGIQSADKLRELLARHLKEVGELDANMAKTRRDAQVYYGTTKERVDAGVFYTHVGLVRLVLEREFGDKFRDYRNSRVGPRL
ncbi:MAG TPA: hypothetical protein VF756_01730 [Thermoanaerobaculia bacterium]